LILFSYVTQVSENCQAVNVSVKTDVLRDEVN
jgi:hypothetical protein